MREIRPSKARRPLFPTKHDACSRNCRTAEGPALDAERRRILGLVGAKERFNRLGAKLLAARWDMRVRLLGDSIQPSTIVTRNRNSKVKAW